MFNISPNSSSNTFRARRVELLNEIVAPFVARNGKCTVLDVGGTSGFWKTWENHIDFDKVEITCVNLNPAHAQVEFDKVRVEYGNGCDLSRYGDGQFDVAFSNSVIEHVGMWSNMAAFASETRRICKSYVIQTPYVWFPVEPHARTPLIHWLPESIAYRILFLRACGYWGKARDVGDAVEKIQSAKMLDIRQFSYLYPDAEVQRERFFGLVKSLVAVRRAA